MSTRWILTYYCFPPLKREPVVVSDVFDDEGELFDFCNDNPEDIIEVLQIERFPLSIADVTDEFVKIVPDRFDREASRADFQNDERREGVR